MFETSSSNLVSTASLCSSSNVFPAVRSSARRGTPKCRVLLEPLAWFMELSVELCRDRAHTTLQHLSRSLLGLQCWLALFLTFPRPALPKTTTLLAPPTRAKTALPSPIEAASSHQHGFGPLTPKTAAPSSHGLDQNGCGERNREGENERDFMQAPDRGAMETLRQPKNPPKPHV